MDYVTARNEPRMDADHDETFAEFRSTNEPRLMYYEHPVQFDPDHEGPLTDLTPDELRAVFSEMLDYTGMCSVFDWPLPPKGLPGFLNVRRSRNDPEADLIEIGLRYLYHAVNKEPRGMHLRWNEARDFIHGIETEAQTRTETRIMMEEFDRADAREAAQAPQRVYFIGAETGPIKIGIASNPVSRLRTLQTGHHERLELLATCDGGMTKERAYHDRFAAHRLSGEWFARAPEILAEIGMLTPNPTLHP